MKADGAHPQTGRTCLLRQSEQKKIRVKSEMEAIVRLAQNSICSLADAAGMDKVELAKEFSRREEHAGRNILEILQTLEKQRLGK
jgi:hypothetical protein